MSWPAQNSRKSRWRSAPRRTAEGPGVCRPPSSVASDPTGIVTTLHDPPVEFHDRKSVCAVGGDERHRGVQNSSCYYKSRHLVPVCVGTWESYAEISEMRRR